MAFSVAEEKRKIQQKKLAYREAAEKAFEEKDASEESTNALDEMKKDIEDHEARLGRVEDALSMSDADPVENSMDDDDTVDNSKSYKSVDKTFTRSNVVLNHARPAGERKGIRAARFIVGAGIAEKHGAAAGSGYVRDTFEDREVAKAVSALAAGATSLGGATIPQDFRNELIELLRSEAVVRKSGARIYRTPNGDMTLPRQLTSSTAMWVGENADIAASNPTFDDIQMTAKRLAAVVPVSNVLLRQSAMAIDTIVLDDTIKQMVNTEDLTLLAGTPSSVAPGGLMYYTPAANVITPASVSGLSGSALGTAINSTLFALKGALQYANIRLNGACWYMNPVVVNYLSTLLDGNGQPIFRHELDNGTLMGFPVYMTNELPTNLGASGAQGSPIIFGQPDTYALSESLDMLTTVSDVASYSINGAYASAFSKDQTVFRVIESIDFNMRYTNGVAYAIVPWATANYTANGGIIYPPTTPNTVPSYANSTQANG